MRQTKIYIGNIPTTASKEELIALFEKYGPVEECDIVKNYAFVHMQTEEGTKSAIEGLHKSQFCGAEISVEASHSKVRQRPGMGNKGQCFRCGRSGHWSKECPKAFGPGGRGGGRMGGGGGGGYGNYGDGAYGGGGYGGGYAGGYGGGAMPGFRGRYGMDRSRPYPDPYDRPSGPPMGGPGGPPPVRDDYGGYDRYGMGGPRMQGPPPPPMYSRRSPPGGPAPAGSSYWM